MNLILIIRTNAVRMKFFASWNLPSNDTKASENWLSLDAKRASTVSFLNIFKKKKKEFV